MKKADIKVGSVVVADYSYSSCRVFFYKVTKVTENFVWLTGIGKKYTSGAPNTITSTVVPNDNGLYGQTLRRKLKGDSEYCWISISDYISAHCIHTDGRTYQELCD